jgi:hypothetical protein
LLTGYIGSILPGFATRIEADEAVLKKPILEAREIRLVDADGKVVVELGTSPEAVGRIVFRDQKGIIRCSMGLAKDGATGLDLFNHEGVSLATFGSSADGAIGLAFNDASGSSRLNLGVSGDSAYGLEFFAPDQISLGGIGISNTGEYGLNLADSAGNTRFDLGLTAEGEAGFRILDDSGQTILSQPE